MGSSKKIRKFFRIGKEFLSKKIRKRKFTLANICECAYFISANGEWRRTAPTGRSSKKPNPSGNRLRGREAGTKSPVGPEKSRPRKLERGARRAAVQEITISVRRLHGRGTEKRLERRPQRKRAPGRRGPNRPTGPEHQRNFVSHFPRPRDVGRNEAEFRALVLMPSKRVSLTILTARAGATRGRAGLDGSRGSIVNERGALVSRHG